jgi:hypothetical protein
MLKGRPAATQESKQIELRKGYWGNTTARIYDVGATMAWDCQCCPTVYQ